MVLLALVFYFLVRGIWGFLREGSSYLLSTWRLLGVCKLALAASVCGLHLSRCVSAQRQWALYLSHPRDAFTDFYPLAKQSQTYTVMAALLLFILVLKVRNNHRKRRILRTIIKWSVQLGWKQECKFQCEINMEIFCLKKKMNLKTREKTATLPLHSCLTANKQGSTVVLL